MNPSIAAQIVSYTGAGIGFCLNLSAVVMFIEYFKGRRLVKEFPHLMFFVGMFNNSNNLGTNLIPTISIIPLISNCLCSSVFSCWTILYLYISHKEFKLFLLHTFILFNLCVEYVVIFCVVIEPNTPYEKKKIGPSFFNIVAIIATIGNNAAPGQNIIKVIKEKNFKLIPIWTSFFGTLCSFCWFLYPILDATLNSFIRLQMIVSNGLSVLINIAQILAWGYAYKASGGKEVNVTENNEGDVDSVIETDKEDQTKEKTQEEEE